MQKQKVVLLALLLMFGCGDSSNDKRGPLKGEPPYPPSVAQANSWIIDTVDVVTKDTITDCNRICDALQRDGIAEVVVVIMSGVKRPEIYATGYGRATGVGSKGLSLKGGGNGLVYLIRPEAKNKLTDTIGDGWYNLTRTMYMEDIYAKAIEPLNFGNFDLGVRVLIQETNKTLRALHLKKGGTR